MSSGLPGGGQIRPQGQSEDHEGLPPLLRQQQQQRLRLRPPRSMVRQRSVAGVARAGSIIAKGGPRAGAKPSKPGYSRLYLELSDFACGEGLGGAPDPDQLASMRRQVTHALTITPLRAYSLANCSRLFDLILIFFFPTAPSDMQSWVSTYGLLQTYQQLVGRGPCAKTDRCDIYIFFYLCSAGFSSRT